MTAPRAIPSPVTMHRALLTSLSTASLVACAGSPAVEAPRYDATVQDVVEITEDSGVPLRPDGGASADATGADAGPPARWVSREITAQACPMGAGLELSSSDDGQRLAWVSCGDDPTRGRVYVYDLQAQQTVEVTAGASERSEAGFGRGAVLSPDGALVAWRSDADTVRVRRADATGPIVTLDAMPGARLAFSPDHGTLVAVRDGALGGEANTLSLGNTATGQTRRVYDAPSTGQYLGFGFHAARGAEAPSRSPWRPSFGRDGAQLLFVAPGSTLRSVALSGGAPRVFEGFSDFLVESVGAQTVAGVLPGATPLGDRVGRLGWLDGQARPVTEGAPMGRQSLVSATGAGWLYYREAGALWRVGAEGQAARLSAAGTDSVVTLDEGVAVTYGAGPVDAHRPDATAPERLFDNPQGVPLSVYGRGRDVWIVLNPAGLNNTLFHARVGGAGVVEIDRAQLSGCVFDARATAVFYSQGAELKRARIDGEGVPETVLAQTALGPAAALHPVPAREAMTLHTRRAGDAVSVTLLERAP